MPAEWRQMGVRCGSQCLPPPAYMNAHHAPSLQQGPNKPLSAELERAASLGSKIAPCPPALPPPPSLPTAPPLLAPPQVVVIPSSSHAKETPRENSNKSSPPSTSSETVHPHTTIITVDIPPECRNQTASITKALPTSANSSTDKTPDTTVTDGASPSETGPNSHSIGADTGTALTSISLSPDGVGGDDNAAQPRHSRKEIPITMRAAIVVLRETAGWTFQQIHERLDISISSAQGIVLRTKQRARAKARTRGGAAAAGGAVTLRDLLDNLDDLPRGGRPKKRIEEGGGTTRR